MNSKVLAAVFLVLCVSVISTKEIRDTASDIQNGLSLAKQLGDFVVAKNFTNVIGKLATALTPYLGIVGPFVSFVMGFVGKPDSAELKAIKHLTTEVDNRFDKVDLQFVQVKKLIDWKTIQIHYSDIEQKITAVNREFENIYKFSTNSVTTTSSNFISNYESDYQNSGSKLYDGIMNEARLFGDDLFQAVMKYTEYDRAKCQTFMLGNLQLLLKAAKLELAYHQLKGHESALHDYENQWTNRISKVGRKMLSTDKTIASKVLDQSEKDIKKYLTNHPTSQKNNKDFNNGLYQFLSTKFYWRDWLTVTYKAIEGGDKHWVGQCGGAFVFRNHGRNIVVASVDGHKAHINMGLAKSIVDRVNSCTTRKSYHGGYLLLYPTTTKIRTDAHKAFDSFPSSVKDHCDPYAGGGVIEYTTKNGYDVHFKAAPNRMYLRAQEECNFVYIFG